MQYFELNNAITNPTEEYDQSIANQNSIIPTLRKMEISLNDAVSREIDAVCRHVSTILSIYEEVNSYLPLTPESLFEKLRDGILLGYLLHHYYPESINLCLLTRELDLNQMNRPQSKVTFEVNSNLNLVVNASKSIKGLVIVNLGAEDILNGHCDLVLGLLWQILNSRLTGSISLQAHPELVRLAESNESLASLAALKPEALLFRWFNFHLRRAGCLRRVSNLGRDLCDSELYVILMNQVVPNCVSDQDVGVLLEISAASYEGKLQRARLLLEFSKKIGCHEFLSPQDIVQGHSRLNFAFTATLFNRHIGISLPSEDELVKIRKQYEDAIKDKSELQVKLQAGEFALATHMENAASEIKLLRDRIANIEIDNNNEIKRQKALFDLAKEELATQYKESLDSAIKSERRAHQEELWELVSHQKEARRQLLMIHSFIKSQFKAEDLERYKLSDLHEDSDLDQVIKVIGDGINHLIKKIYNLDISLDSLRTTVAHKEKVNEVMGDKIREYTELVIIGKKSDKVRRGSILKRFFANSK